MGNDVITIRGVADPVVGTVLTETWKTVTVKTADGEQSFPGANVGTVSRGDTPDGLDAALLLGDMGRIDRAIAVLDGMLGEKMAQPWLEERILFHRANFLRIRSEITGEGAPRVQTAFTTFIERFPDSRLTPMVLVTLMRGARPMPGATPPPVAEWMKKLEAIGGPWLLFGRLAQAISTATMGAHDRALKKIAEVEGEAESLGSEEAAGEVAFHVLLARAEVAVRRGEPMEALELLGPVVGAKGFIPVTAAADAIVLLARAAREAVPGKPGVSLAMPLYRKVMRWFPTSHVALAAALADGANGAEVLGDDGLAEWFRSMRKRRYPFTG